MANIVIRGKTWHLKRRVPKRYESLEKRTTIWESLRTDSRSVALQKAEQVWARLIDGWEARLSGRDGDAESAFRAAHDLAAMRGFTFLTAEKVADAQIEEILARIDASRAADGKPDPLVSAALLGAVDEPKMMLSDLVERVETISALDNRAKSTTQMRLWRTPRHRAVKYLMAALGGDRPVASITTAEARLHKKWWGERIRNEGLKVETANKDLHYLAGMLTRFYDDLEHPDPQRPYASVSIRSRFETPDRKMEVPVSVIKSKWFAEGAFDKLNAEARDILLISLETGCRQSEIHDLPARAFHLNDLIPHIVVANELDDDPAERREIKNQHSVRSVPLVGVALAAALRHPIGFPRYRGKRGYSALVNKYLRAHDLVPHGVTAGGLRHTWESRLKAAGISADDRGEMMGHSVRARRGREVYGDELSLRAKRDLAASIALTVPAHLS